MSIMKINGSDLIARCFRMLIACAFLATSFVSVSAQTEEVDDSAWSQPLNLSRSSGASWPGMVLDSRNVLHVFWEDVYRGYLYRKLEGGEWSTVTPVNFPFRTATNVVLEEGEVLPTPPLFVTDQNERVHALWIDSRSVLYHSYVKEESFGNYGSWLPPQAITEAVIDMDVEIDSNGDVHLVYIKSSKSVFEKSGVYYRKLVNGGYWERAILLYESLYLRSIDGVASNVDLAATTLEDGTVKLYIVWDNRSLNRIFGINYQNGAWGEPFEVEGPNVRSVAVQPVNGMVAAKGEQVVYMWQLTQSGGGCVQYYQSSEDAGETWSARRSMLMELKDCPDQNRIVSEQGNAIILSSILNSQIYFSLWNGKEWSRPEPQVELSEFVDPDSLNLLTLQQPQFVVAPDNRIFAVGMGSSLGGGTDVWVTDRLLGPEDDWFPQGSKWTNFERIAQLDTSIASYTTISDAAGWLHVFWATQARAGDELSERKIFYMRWDGETWSAPVDIIISNSGKISPIRAVSDEEDEKLILIWADNNSGEIFISSAERLEALDSREWSQPILISSPWPITASPDIAIANDGRFYLTFAIPINEFRGIYLTTSEDDGQTWSSPSLVYDGAAEDWLGVEEPRIAVNGDDHIYLMFARKLLPLDKDNKTLYFTKSEDLGKNWDKPVVVSDNAAEWGRVVVVNDTINRVWLEKEGRINYYHHDISIDAAKSWKKSDTIQEVLDETYPIDFAIDSLGDVHLVQMKSVGTRQGILQHWVLEGGRWYVVEKYELGVDSMLDVTHLRLVVLPNNELVAIFNGVQLSDRGESIGDNLFFTRYVSVETDQEQLQALETLPPSPATEVGEPENMNEPEETETVEIIPTPTISFDDSAPVAATSSMQRIVYGTGIGLLAAAVIVVGFLFISRRLK